MSARWPASITLCLLSTIAISGAAFGRGESFIEDYKSKNSELISNSERYKSKVAPQDEFNGSGNTLLENSRAIFRKFDKKTVVPGFISATPIPAIGKVIGPDTLSTGFRMGDTIYIRWNSVPGPREGDRYQTYTPAVVLQSLLNPTDFIIRLRPNRVEDIPKHYRMAGYFYDATGTIRIMKVDQGLVTAIVEQLSGQLLNGDEIMQMLPTHSQLPPIHHNIQMAAAIVAGSPVDRLSTTERSIVYINRGARDGVRLGTVFESVETVKLDGAIATAAPLVSAGEVKVIYVTDSYSTAMITKQFDVIRIGSLLRTKQNGASLARKSPFGGFDSRGRPNERQEIDLGTEVPDLESMKESQDPSLPDPLAGPKPTPLSELDALERSLQLKSLTPEEKARLNTLSKQEKLESEEPAGGDAPSNQAPGLPALENSFEDGKRPEKKDTKKKKRKNDEEELNLLMMEN